MFVLHFVRRGEGTEAWLGAIKDTVQNLDAGHRMTHVEVAILGKEILDNHDTYRFVNLQ